jgi:hypothetical protein
LKSLVDRGSKEKEPKKTANKSSAWTIIPGFFFLFVSLKEVISSTSG